MASDNLMAGIAGAASGVRDIFSEYFKSLLRQREQRAQDYIQGSDIPKVVRDEIGMGEDEGINKSVLPLITPQNVWNPETKQYERMSLLRGRSYNPSSSTSLSNYRDTMKSMKLREEFINRPEVKEYQTINTQVKSMDSLLNSTMSGDEQSKLALDQGLITMFNKLTDPNSVVRESEYERTPSNLSLMNRATGALKKLGEGGAGLTNEDRKTLVKAAKVIANERGKVYNRTRVGYENLAGEYGIDKNQILATIDPFSEYQIEDFGVPTIDPKRKPKPAAKPVIPPGNNTVDENIALQGDKARRLMELRKKRQQGILK